MLREEEEMRALALCMILLVSFAASGATEERNTFFATDLGFSMKVPIDESYREPSYQVATFFLPPSDGFAPNVNVQRQAFAGTIEQYDELSVAQFSAYKFTVVSRKLEKGVASYEYKGQTGAKRLHWYARALKKEKHVYLITASTLESQWKGAKKKLIGSVDSFRFDKQGARALGAASQKIASSYFEALISGDAERANELSKAPFFFDRKRVLKEKTEVETAHLRIAEDKGKRDVPKYTIARTSRAPRLDRDVFPKYAAYRILIGDEHIDIYVSDDDSPKVIGFSD